MHRHTNALVRQLVLDKQRIELDGCQQHSATALAPHAKIIEHLCWCVAVIHALAVLDPVLTDAAIAREAAYGYQHYHVTRTRLCARLCARVLR